MPDSRQESPIYDELVQQRGDVLAESRTAQREAQSQVKKALDDLRTVTKPGNSAWFT